MKNPTAYSLLLLALLLSQCSVNKDSNQSLKDETNMRASTIMELTTFNINPNVNPEAFKKRDLEIENDYTSKQPGFIKRQSGVNDKGEYAVLVYWKSTAAAAASMKKFMSDASVADYAQMINGLSMKMSRYAMDKDFDAPNSNFVEVMTFNVKQGTDLAKFKLLNYKVETDFTGKRTGFLQRLIGVDDEGRQAVAIYWTDKTSSDASLDGFMAHPTSKAFMQEMDAATMFMGRYSFLNKRISK
ncbi:MAG: hypothetical protein AAF985_04610 [Bacteroidota bacterium]